MSREHILAGVGTPVYVSQTGTRDEILAVVYLSETVATTAIKTWDGLAKASIKTVNGLVLASVKTINGLA
jgi:hypothetical protein